MREWDGHIVEWTDKATGRATLKFCETDREAQKLVEELRAKGYRAASWRL